MMNQILREVYSTGVVIEHTHCILRNLIVVKQLLHLEKLCAATSNSYVLCFCCREGHWILFLAHPRDKVVTKVETTIWSTLPIIHTPSPIWIWITHKASIRILWVPQAIIRSAINISYDSLHSSKVEFLRSGLILSTNSHAKSNILSTCHKIE